MKYYTKYIPNAIGPHCFRRELLIENSIYWNDDIDGINGIIEAFKRNICDPETCLFIYQSGPFETNKTFDELHFFRQEQLKEIYMQYVDML